MRLSIRLAHPTRLRLLLLSAVAFAALAVPAAAGGGRPETLPLPDGFQPEGIATLDSDEVLVGSIPTGALYRANVKTGRGRLLAAGADGRQAIGLKVAGGRVYVSGGPTGKVRIQDATTGEVLREEQAGTPGATFINDVTLTRRAAYFTDSQAAQIYELPLRGGPLRTIPLTGDFQLVDGFNLNGIAASRSGFLLAVQSATATLFRINPVTGRTKRVDLGGVQLTNGDGLLLEGRFLSVVQNRSNQITQFRLRRDLLSGRLLRTLTDPDFDVPTTVTRAGGRLYAPNARFGTPPTPETRYDVVKVDGSEGRSRGGHR